MTHIRTAIYVFLSKSIHPVPERQLSFDDVDDKTVEVFTKMTGTAKPPKLTSKLKKEAMEESIKWLHENEPDLHDVSDNTLEAVTNMTSVAIPGNLDKKAKKKKDEGSYCMDAQQ